MEREVTDVTVRSLCGLLTTAARHMSSDANNSSIDPDKKVFLRAWEALLRAMAEWMFLQLHAGILTPAQIVGVAEFQLDVAREYLAHRRAAESAA
jgi:hypothetical protein